jgi:translation elongation factor EF-G
LADYDDGLAETYLGGGDISHDMTRLAVQKASFSFGFVGVIPGSAFQKPGVRILLDLCPQGK